VVLRRLPLLEERREHTEEKVAVKREREEGEREREKESSRV
jgi:hypothetical protein